MKEELVHLGVANRPHGIKGGVLFKLFNQEESVLKKGSKVTIFPESSKSSVDPKGEQIKIENIHFGNKTICYLEDIKDRNIVEKMLPFSIYFPRDEFPIAKSDEVYIDDLIGLTVIDIDGYEIGKIISFSDNGFQVILKVKLEGQTIELPFVENFFPHLNLEAGKITMISPEFDS
jgi:16S rRNA processing protein RimM